MPDQEFSALALQIFSYQYKTSKPYRLFCNIDKVNPAGVKSWRDIPAMPTQGFKDFRLASFRGKALKVFHTSGTTRAERGSHYFDTLKLYQASLLPPFQKYLLPEGKRMEMYFLTASPEELKDSSLSYMMGQVLVKAGASKKRRFYVVKNKILFEKLYHDLSQTSKPVMLLATAFSLKSFLDGLRKNKKLLKLPAGSRLMETGGFKGRVKEVSKRALYRECRLRLGIPEKFCVSEYGMTEMSSQFYDTTLYDAFKRLHRKPVKKGPAWLRTLVVNPVTGKEVSIGKKGILRHFDLANRGSVVAIQTEDAGIRRRDGFELLGRAQGAAIRGCSLTYEHFLNDKSIERL